MRQVSEVTKLSSNILRKHAESKDVEEEEKGGGGGGKGMIDDWLKSFPS